MSEPFAPVSRSELSDEAAMVSAFLPLAILGAMLLVWFGFQAIQLRAERDIIHNALKTQNKQIEESKKLRDSFFAIAHGAEVLADGGNANARLVVDGLKKRGITVTPNPPAPGGAAPAAPAK